MLETVTATRFVLPLKEGGSLPGLMEADDDGTYVVKFRGAGQGLKVLVAEVVVGELARALGIRVPRLVVVDLADQIARYEADEEVQDLLTASVGRNLGVDYLPGSFGYDGSRAARAEVADEVLWLDSLTANVDRTWSNPNLLMWHGQAWAIDHGAALYFHHQWPSRAPDPDRFANQPFDADRHVLRDLAHDVSGAHERLGAQLTPELLDRVLAAVPDEWLEPGVEVPDPTAARSAYRSLLLARVANPGAWLPGDAP